MKAFYRRSISGLLALLICSTTIWSSGVTAFAASSSGETAKSYSVAFPRDGDANLDTGGTWGHDELHYMNGWTSGEKTWMTTLHTIGDFNGPACYCIEPGVPRLLERTYARYGEDCWKDYPSECNSTIDADTIKTACAGAQAVCVSVKREKKTEQPPRLYDLTTLQREANRLFGFTAKQTLDYAQQLYEKKLLTYPRTDSQYLTDDMQPTAESIVSGLWPLLSFAAGLNIAPQFGRVLNSKKVSDHHAIIPTMEFVQKGFDGLTEGEKKLLSLVCCKLLCAVAAPHVYEAVTATFTCAGNEFTAKGKTILTPGWKEIERRFKASFKTDADEDAPELARELPEITEGQTFDPVEASITEHFTTPPKPYTEDTLLSAMERAGAEDMPEDAERKGLGTPATRAGILEKLVSTGFLERKKSKKTVQLMPSHDAVSLITVLPEQLQSPLLTAEWEYRLGEIERGELAPEDFMAGISAMLKELVGTYQAIKGTEYLFSPSHEVVGKCPRCGGEVAEMQKGFFCQTESCKFAIWKNNKWWEMKHKQPTKAIVTALLKDGRAHVRGLYSEKTGKTYDATVVLADDGQYANFKLEFDQQKGGKR